MKLDYCNETENSKEILTKAKKGGKNICRARYNTISNIFISYYNSNS